MDDITDFLYLIGSVFAPMIAVQIADAFILHSDASAKELSASRMIIWLVGFVIYRILMNIDFVLGNTLPDMLITMFITVVWGLCVERTRARHKIRNPHKMQKQSCQKLCFFRIHAKWYFIPVGRDALIPPPGLAVYSIIC